ncbi:hypothetical protein J6590_030230 [Homalodisca vitripennis]|nr:hypothetical protein J6590_030230 [Homalodisca vitripennis]
MGAWGRSPQRAEGERKSSKSKEPGTAAQLMAGSVVRRISSTTLSTVRPAPCNYSCTSFCPLTLVVTQSNLSNFSLNPPSLASTHHCNHPLLSHALPATTSQLMHSYYDPSYFFV